MYKLILLLIALSIMYVKPIAAQKVSVYETKKNVDGEFRVGMATVILLDQEFVEKIWNRSLREYGKLSAKKGYAVIEQALIPQVSSAPVKLYASSGKSANQGVEVWWSIIKDGEALSPSKSADYKEAEKLLADFARKCYIEDINKDIEQAEKALMTTVKAYEKKISEGQGLEKQLSRNLADSITLVQKTMENLTQRDQLRKDLDQNGKDQIVANQEVEKMRRARDLIREKLTKVE